MLSRRLFTLGLAAGTTLPLAACLEPLVPAPPPEFEPLDYTARRDGAHTLPAVPIDQVPAWLHRQVVPFETGEAPGTIVIRQDQGLLHLVLEDGYALRYGISVGREGLDWRGEAEIYRTAHWPTWTPTPNMIRRDPSLERWADGQPGGPRNPLGARALYLRTRGSGADEGIRIHGTPDWRSIGHRASSGCFRMINHDVIDLYGRVGRGTRVVVL
ncbi:MAG TPA: L,D-transpeptidase [Paracoccus sp.]|nr:L,D-transpeptidase [Paracoccus sp. (in: a-proteobacteria)]